MSFRRTSRGAGVAACVVAGAIAFSSGTALADPTAPGVPNNVTATAGDQTVDVSFAPPTSNGGSAVTGYTASLFRDEEDIPVAQKFLDPSTTSTSFTGTDGVSNRVSYTVFVTATNSVGTGPAGTDTATPEPSSPTEELNGFAVNGTNHHLFARLSDQSTYNDLGGILTDAPAVAVDPDTGHIYSVVRGRSVNGNNVYIRSDSQGFAAFVTGPADCREPAAVIADGVLSVACRGSNNRLYVARATLPDSGLPHVTGFTDYGGVLLYGPSVIATGDPNEKFEYDVVGTNHRVFFRSDLQPFGSAGAPLACYGTLTTDNEFAGFSAVCPGSDRALQYQLFTDQTGDDGWFGTVPGVVVGRPAAVVNGDGTADAYVTGTDKRVYLALFGSDGTITTSFHAIGGAGTGMGAVALSSASPLAHPNAGPKARHGWSHARG
jgi:hypothetical protein